MAVTARPLSTIPQPGPVYISAPMEGWFKRASRARHQPEV